MTATYGTLCAWLGDFAKEMMVATTPFRRRELMTNISTRARRDGFTEDEIDHIRVLAVRELRRIQRSGTPGRKSSGRPQSIPGEE